MSVTSINKSMTRLGWEEIGRDHKTLTAAVVIMLTLLFAYVTSSGVRNFFNLNTSQVDKNLGSTIVKSFKASHAIAGGMGLITLVGLVFGLHQLGCTSKVGMEKERLALFREWHAARKEFAENPQSLKVEEKINELRKVLNKNWKEGWLAIIDMDGTTPATEGTKRFAQVMEIHKNVETIEQIEEAASKLYDNFVRRRISPSSRREVMEAALKILDSKQKRDGNDIVDGNPPRGSYALIHGVVTFLSLGNCLPENVEDLSDEELQIWAQFLSRKSKSEFREAVSHVSPQFYDSLAPKIEFTLAGIDPTKRKARKQLLENVRDQFILARFNICW